VIADAFLKRYVACTGCTDLEKDLVAEARDKYLRVGTGGDMEFVLSDFMKPVPVGCISGGERLLHIFVNRFIRDVDVISYEEAIDFMTEKTSSPGWPYTEMGYHSRAEVLEDGQAVRYAKEFEESGLHGLWTGCLKEEVLKRKKFESGHTRFFACCPIHTQIVLLRYCAPFNAAMIEWSRQEVWPFYVGRSPFAGGWNRLCIHLDKGAVFSLDETLWDTTLSRELFAALYRVRNSAFRVPLSNDKLYWLVDEVVSTFIISDTGEVVRKYNGNASGSSNTLVDNSMILFMLYLEAYSRVYPGDSIDDFFSNVFLNIIGDDNICCVSLQRPLFTKDVIMSTMREWGINPRVESETPSIIGAHYVAKDVGVRVIGGLRHFVPLPGRVRLLAHYLYSTPGDNLLLSAIKCNSLLLEVPFDDVLWRMLYTFQSWYLAAKGDMYRWCTSDLSLIQFESGIYPRSIVYAMYLGFENLCQAYIKSFDARMPKQGKKKTAKAGAKMAQSARKAQSVSSSVPFATNKTSVNKPALVQAKNGTFVIKHREFVADVSSGGIDFALTAYRINPGNVNLFPWMAGLALNFETYKFRTLHFDYVPTCSVQNAGSVAMSIDYDVLDESPVSKTEILTNKGARSSALWKNLRVSVKNEDAQGLGLRRYCLAASEYSAISVVYPDKADPKTYDLGYFNIALCNSTVEFTGELFVEYEVELHTPQVRAIDIYESSGKVNPLLGVSKNVIFGTARNVYGCIPEDGIKYIGNKAYMLLKHGVEQLLELDGQADAATTGFAPGVKLVDFDTAAECKEGAITTNYVHTSANGQWAGGYNVTSHYPGRSGVELDFSGMGPGLLDMHARLAPYLAKWA